MVRDVDLVEGMTQEIFISAYRALHQFCGDAQLYTWLYRIAINRTKIFLLELKRDPTLAYRAYTSNEEMDETYSSRDEPIANETSGSALTAKELALAVNAAMAALTEDLSQALILREIEGLRYMEIAAMMNCPTGIDRSPIFRTREAVSARVKPLLEKQTSKCW
jgi:RNA polymerase sigma-70 factor (ECF subfamily)